MFLTRPQKWFLIRKDIGNSQKGLGEAQILSFHDSGLDLLPWGRENDKKSLRQPWRRLGEVRPYVYQGMSSVSY
jgi:hypothetical protein